jgi:D-serine deaminase-like pyridoxal phosphate-dependent protein
MLFPELDTPALLIDLDILDRNLDRMAAALQSTSCGIRPHFKSHRLSAITRRQIARGAHGVTCAKLGEAELLGSLGIDSLLVANEVVGPHKWARLARLAREREVLVGLENFEVGQATSAAAREADATVNFLVDLNSGLNRCGVSPGPGAIELALRLAALPNLRFRGLMAYEGHAVLMPREEKEATCRAAMTRVAETADLCAGAGLPVEIISAGGTGTWNVTCTCPGVTELQAGTYALMDLLFREGALAEFDYACTVLTTVISRPTPERAVTDGGKKALHPSFGFARPVDLPGSQLTGLHSEHGILELQPEAQGLRIGDRVRFIPSYVEGTTNLYDRAYVIQGSQVVDEWPVDGRGRSQ